MPNITDQNLFKIAAAQLAAFRRDTTHYKGRFVQIFLAMKFYQNELPSMFSGQYISTAVLQSLLDDLYSKQSRNLEDCVFVLFQNEYHARTGITAKGNKVPQNTWRNNFNLQKGIVCYAPPNDLASQTFLDQPRRNCRYLISKEDGALAGGHCSLCTTGAEYRNEDHRKWLKMAADGSGYAVLDLLNTANFSPYVAPDGARIPLLPLIVALYYDAIPGLKNSRDEVGILDFLSDFNFSDSELETYFDASPTNQYNRVLLEAKPNAGLQQLTVEPNRGDTRRTAARTQRETRVIREIPKPNLAGTPAPPPATNSGWDAEQYVASVLVEAGWDVYDVSRQRLGYDLLVKRGRKTRYIDVKSSVGLCSPNLTGREWQQAAVHGEQYILAIAENFNPLGENRIHWVPDPVRRCLVRESPQIIYALARSSWIRAEIDFADI